MFEDELQHYINDGLTENHLHQFKQKIDNIVRPPRCNECCQRVIPKAHEIVKRKKRRNVRMRSPTMSELENDIANTDVDEIQKGSEENSNLNEEAWNESDGMSESILSSDGEKEDYQHLKRTAYTE